MENGKNGMEVRYWGTRGSIPTPSERDFSTLVYGGNTSCVEIALPDASILIDAGSGIRRAGLDMMKRKKGDGTSVKEYKLLISHSHWDHIQGFPFFVPAYIPGNELYIYGQKKDFTHLGRTETDPSVLDKMDPNDTHRTLMHQQSTPYFPVPLEKLQARLRFRDIKPGDEVPIDGFRISTKALNHPDGYIGFRIEHDGMVVAYASDVEPDGKEFDDNLLELADRADLLIHDSQYTPEEYQGKKGWGHSTYEDAINNAIRANVRKIALTHHDPLHDDRSLDRMLERANEYARTALQKYKRDLDSLDVVMAEEGKKEVIVSRCAVK